MAACLPYATNSWNCRWEFPGWETLIRKMIITRSRISRAQHATDSHDQRHGANLLCPSLRDVLSYFSIVHKMNNFSPQIKTVRVID